MAPLFPLNSLAGLVVTIAVRIIAMIVDDWNNQKVESGDDQVFSSKDK